MPDYKKNGDKAIFFINFFIHFFINFFILTIIFGIIYKKYIINDIIFIKLSPVVVYLKLFLRNILDPLLSFYNRKQKEKTKNTSLQIIDSYNLTDH